MLAQMDLSTLVTILKRFKTNFFPGLRQRPAESGSLLPRFSALLYVREVIEVGRFIAPSIRMECRCYSARIGNIKGSRTKKGEDSMMRTDLNGKNYIDGASRDMNTEYMLPVVGRNGLGTQRHKKRNSH